MGIIKKSLAIAILSTIYDQIYHILFQQPHSIITYLPTVEETYLYIATKFIAVLLASYIILRFIRIQNMRTLSVLISITGALIFGFYLQIYIPTQYSILIHLAHAIVIYLACYVVLIKNYFGGWLK